MKSKFKFLGFIALVAVIWLTMTGCGLVSGKGKFEVKNDSDLTITGIRINYGNFDSGEISITPGQTSKTYEWTAGQANYEISINYEGLEWPTSWPSCSMTYPDGKKYTYRFYYDDTYNYYRLEEVK
jgi:hypothetical protein